MVITNTTGLTARALKSQHNGKNKIHAMLWIKYRVVAEWLEHRSYLIFLSGLTR